MPTLVLFFFKRCRPYTKYRISVRIALISLLVLCSCSDLPTSYKVQWALQNISSCSAMMVSGLYWTILYKAGKQNWSQHLLAASLYRLCRSGSSDAEIREHWKCEDVKPIFGVTGAAAVTPKIREHWKCEDVKPIIEVTGAAAVTPKIGEHWKRKDLKLRANIGVVEAVAVTPQIGEHSNYEGLIRPFVWCGGRAARGGGADFFYRSVKRCMALVGTAQSIRVFCVLDFCRHRCRTATTHGIVP